MLQGAGYQYLISPFDAKAAAGQAAVPTNWYLSFAGATGASTNIHEIANLSVCSNSQNTPTLHHVEIAHDGSGFPGVGEPITIKACADDSCSVLYLNAVSVNFSTSLVSGSGTNSWVPANTINFTGGQTTITLTQTATATLTLGATATSPTATNATACLIGATTSCTMVFNTVSFDAVEQTPANQVPPKPIFTKLSGVNFYLDVVAVTSGAINTTFTGSISVSLVDPSAATGNCNDYPAAGLTAEAPWTYLLANAGRKSFTFNYPYAAKNVKVRIRDTVSNTTYCSSDNFVIRPQVLFLSSTSSIDATAGNTLAAGADFNLTANSGVTSGYIGTIPVIDPTLAALKDHANTTITAGSLSGNFTVGTNGISSTGIFQYLDAGTLTLLPDAVIDSQFFYQDQRTGVYAGIDHGVNGDCVYNSTSTALDVNGRYGCNIGSTAIGGTAAARTSLGPLGRFIPDHFNLLSGSVTAACNGFTYMSQPFTNVAFTLVAKNKNDATMAKYVSGNPPYASIPAYTALPLPSLVAEDGLHQGTNLTSRLSGFTIPNWAAGQNVFTTATAVFSRLLNVTTIVPDGPYDSLTLGVTMADGIGVIAGQDMSATIANCTTNCDAKKLPTSNPTIMRFGYLKLGNAFGSALLNLNLPLQAMYYSAPNQFSINALDSCTTIAPRANIAIGNWTGTLTTGNFGNTNFPIASVTLAGGSGTVVVTKPTGGASGGANIALNLGGSIGAASNCLGGGFPAPTGFAARTWLRGDWCTGANYGRDPNAHLTLGTSNSRPFIHLREKL